MVASGVPVTHDLGPFFDVTPDLLCVIAFDGTFVRVNAAVERILGWRPDELVGRQWRDILHPEDFPAISAEARRIMATGEHSESYELRMRAADGDYRWFQSSASPDLERQVVYTIAVDIDARKRAEQQLIARAESVDAVLDSLAEAVVACDRQGVLTYFNRAAIEHFGMVAEAVPADEWVEHYAIRRLDGSAIGTHELPLYRALHGEIVRNVELIIRPPDAAEDLRVLVSGQPLIDAHGERYGGVIALNDITDRQRTEEALRELRVREVAGEQRARYQEQLRGLARAAVAVNTELELDEMLQSVTEHAATIVGTHQAVTSFTTDTNWAQAINAVYLSEAYAEYADYDAEPDGTGIYALVCETNAPMRLTHEELLAHPAFRAFGDHAEAHPPMRGWLAAPLIARDGSNIGLIQLSDKVDGGEFTEADESILVQLAQMASAAIDKARLHEFAAQQEAARFREELLAGISHDMQTPLAAIVGLSDILLLEEEEGSDQRRLVDTIGRQARSLRRLVQQFLDYSRLEADRPLVLNPRPIDVIAVIDRVVGLFEHLRSFVVGADADLPRVVADPDRLEQVLANLVSNAVKFSEAPVRVVARRGADEVIIDVIDEGPGIDESEIASLFRKFHRGANAARQPGSGLGLYISKALVEAQGGELTATSRRGFGSRFRITLPVGP